MIFNVGNNNADKEAALFETINRVECYVVKACNYKIVESKKYLGYVYRNHETQCFECSSYKKSDQDIPINIQVGRKHIEKPVYAVQVRYDFVITAPWGSDQHIEAGGIVVQNGDDISKKDIYGIDRKAFRNTYAMFHTGMGFDETPSQCLAQITYKQLSPSRATL